MNTVKGEIYSHKYLFFVFLGLAQIIIGLCAINPAVLILIPVGMVMLIQARKEYKKRLTVIGNATYTDGTVYVNLLNPMENIQFKLSDLKEVDFNKYDDSGAIKLVSGESYKFNSKRFGNPKAFVKWIEQQE